MGSIVIFDTNGVFKKTIVGIDKGFDTTKRVTSSYTATEDCLIGVQSVHNVSEGYDGLDDYVVLKGGKAKSDNADFKEFENTASVKWFDEEGFLISYFGDNDVGQNLLLAYSKDGINFKEFLKFVPDNLHTIRDPSIIHHKNGWWYVVHTNTPYGQSISSEKFNIIKSRDLIHWYNVARIGFDNVKNWAPEFFVDSDGSVHIIGSINMSSGAEKFQPYIFSALDDDLSSWSDGVKIQGAFNSATTSTSDSWIDGFMFKIGSKYHFIIKDEAVGHRWLSIFTSSSLKTGFDTILKDGSASWGSVSQKVEAPCVMALENGNYRIYADGLPQDQGGLGQFLMYQDFDSSFNPISSDITKITSDSPMRHGTVLRVKGIQKYLSQSEFVAENVSDSAVPTNIESVLEEMREMKKSLIKAGLMKLS
ncbi:glycoside hydrolase family protein [Acinetobacter johnsonii]|nr:family 43 glycosylhydrolase [Acinetobacter johnsonii]SSX66233.1 Glycosyl hydrolases family 43 [Acinetobacter johnsonii]